MRVRCSSVHEMKNGTRSTNNKWVDDETEIFTITSSYMFRNTRTRNLVKLVTPSVSTPPYAFDTFLI